jgi:hypothetical protein
MPENLNTSIGDPFDPRNIPLTSGQNGSQHPSQSAQPVREPDEYHLEGLVGPPPQSADQEKNPPPQKWEPDILRPRHREILRRILEGATYVEIAEAMGIHKQTVMLIATSKLFQQELHKLEAQLDFNIVSRADSMANEALDKIKTLMRSARSEFLQKQCAERILDTAGYSKVERKILGIVTGEDVIRELNKRKREAATGNGSGESRPPIDISDGQASSLERD